MPDSSAGGWLETGGIRRHKAWHNSGLRSNDLRSAHPRKGPVPDRLRAEENGTKEDLPKRCRVAGKYCYFPAPSELDVKVSLHPAQAFTNAPRGARPLFVRPSRTWICRWQLACNNSMLSAVS